LPGRFATREASMPEKKGQTKRARQPRTKTRETLDLTKRIDNWSKGYDDESHADNMRSLLARGFRPAKRKVQRTKP
jgi:hypothetical protein